MIGNYSPLLYILGLISCALSVALFGDLTGVFVGALIGGGAQVGITGTLLASYRPIRDVSAASKLKMLSLTIVMALLAAVSVGLMLI